MPINLSGSLVLTGSLAVTGEITMSGSIASASYAVNTSFLNNSGSGEFVPTGSFNTFSSSILTYTGSANSRLSSIESKTGSYATTGSNIFSDGQYLSSSFNPTGFSTTASLYTDGGLRVTRDAYISGTLYLNNVTVFGTQSVAYISSSQLNIGTNLITVNTDTPSIRFGGLAVYDSGSTGLTGSILWDSETNHWIYSNPSGSSYSGGMFISGPRTSTLGSETGTTSCALMMGQGGDHITSSAIFSYGNATCFYGTSYVKSTGGSYFSGTVGIGTENAVANLTLKENESCKALVLYGRTSDNLVRIDFYRADETCFAGRIQIDNGTTSNLSIRAQGALQFQTGGSTNRLVIANTGEATFACQVCANLVTAPTISAGIPTNSRIVANANTMYGYYDVEANYRWSLGRDVWAGGSGGLSFGVGGTTTCYSMIGDPSGYGCTIGFSVLVPVGCSGTTYEKMRINSTGLGIGISTPCNLLHVRCNVTGDITLARFTNSPGTGNEGAFIGFETGYPAGLSLIGARREGAENDAAIIFAPMLNEASCERMRITSTGNVGILTMSPSYPLTRSGMTMKAATNDGTEFVMLSCADTGFIGGALVRNGSDFGVINRTNGNLIFATNATERAYIASNGFMGVATASPKAVFDVACGNAHSIISTWCKAANNGTMYNGFDIVMAESSFSGQLYVQANGGGIGIQATYDVLASYDRLCVILRNSMNRGNSESLTIPSYFYQAGSKRICIQQNNGASAEMYISAMLIGTAYGGNYICALS